MKRAPRLGHDAGGAGEAQAQAPTCLSSAEEGIEQVSPFHRTDALAAVADPPPQLVCLASRTHLDLSTGGSGLDGVANQGLGQVIQGIRIRPGLRLGLVQLADQANPPGVAFLLEARQARSEDL
jgi:hypothetical protein